MGPVIGILIFVASVAAIVYIIKTSEGRDDLTFFGGFAVALMGLIAAFVLVAK